MPIELEPSLPEGEDIIFVIESDDVIRSALHFILDEQNGTRAFASLELAFAAAAEMAPAITFDSARCKIDAVLGRHRSSPFLLGLLPLSAAW